MTSPYVLSEIAEQDVEDTLTYIANENIKSAHAFVDDLYKTFETLAQNPYMGHIREDLTTRPVRFWTFQ